MDNESKPQTTNYEPRTKLTDTHCHLDFPEFNHDRDQVIRRAQDGGVVYMVNIGSSLAGSERAVELSRRYESVYAAVGIHPHEADKYSADSLRRLKELAAEKKVVAVGEIGLDYYRNLSSAENQKKVFLELIGLAKEFSLPLVIHNRQAEEDTLRILKRQMPLKAVVHCFSGGEEFLRSCLDLGFSVSFTCNITYKKAERLRQVAAAAPLERVFLETDAPYLSPEGMRGRRNEPLNVVYVAQELARIKGLSAAEVAAVSSAAAKEFFCLR